MKVDQLSIFLENKAGRLSDVTSALYNANVNIRALSLADTSDFGILRLIVDDTERAKSVLKDVGFTVGVTSVVAVVVNDQPGGLNHILQVLRNVDVNVEYMYAYVQSDGGNATLIFRFNHTETAIEALKANDIPMISVDQMNG